MRYRFRFSIKKNGCITMTYTFVVNPFPLKTMNHKFIVALGALLLAAFAQAQDTWDLARCVNYALENNITVRIGDLNKLRAEVNYAQAKAQTLPSLNGFASHTYNFGQTIDPYTNQFANSMVQSDNFGLSSSLNLFSGLAVYNSIQQSKHLMLAGAFSSDKAKNDVALLVSSAYLQIVLNEELLKVATQQRNITQQQEERTQKLVDAGAAPLGNLLEVQAQMATEDLNVVQAQNNLDLSYVSLKQLLQVKDADNFRIALPVVELPADVAIGATIGQIYDLAVQNMPELKAAQANYDASEIGVKVAKGGMSPTLSLNASIGTGYSGISKEVVGINSLGQSPIGQTESGETVYTENFQAITQVKPFTDQLNGNFNQSVGFRLSVPIFNGLSTRTNIALAEISRSNSELNLEQAKNTLYTSIQQAYTDAVAALNRYKALQKSEEAFKLSFNYSEQRFNVGMLNVVDYNQSKNRLIKAQSDLLQARYQLIFRLKVLDFYQGRAITL